MQFGAKLWPSCIHKVTLLTKTWLGAKNPGGVNGATLKKYTLPTNVATLERHISMCFYPIFKSAPVSESYLPGIY